MSQSSGRQVEGPPHPCSSSTRGRPQLEWVGQAEGEGRETGEGGRVEAVFERVLREGEMEGTSWRMLREGERGGLSSFSL